LVKTGDLVTRDMLYNGNPQEEQGAIVCRVSNSFLRFGSFEIFAARNDVKSLKTLVDYTIQYHYPHIGKPSKDTYLQFFREVSERSKNMVIHWQRVGFVHGVMNTDNLSILGQTIDYGPYGWLEDYDPNWTPNTTDAQHRRYRFGNQPKIVLWNLLQLANALFPLIEEATPLEDILEEHRQAYEKAYHSMMLSKLGLCNDDLPAYLISNLTVLLSKTSSDMTLFFRELSNLGSMDPDKLWNIVQSTSYFNKAELETKEVREQWNNWFDAYSSAIAKENRPTEERLAEMKKINPKYVLRNYMAQMAIDQAETGDYTLIDELHQLLLHPYDEQAEMEKWYAKRPKWAENKIGCSMLSCSS
ncbi:MAG: protein adenylyltransferase SelO family protein, partial [Flavobacteriales bacterium]